MVDKIENPIRIFHTIFTNYTKALIAVAVYAAVG